MRRIVCFLTCITLVVVKIAAAQEPDSTQMAQDLFDEGQKAYGDGDHERAIEAYLEASTYPDAYTRKSTLFYNVSCSYSLLGKAEQALAYLDSAIDAGYTNYRWTYVDSDFGYLKEDFKEKFDAVCGRMKNAKAVEVASNTPVCIVIYDNYDGPLDVSGYDWEDINRPEMDTLRSGYGLHRLVSSEETEFGKMKRLLDWVATRWQHDGSNMAPKRTALAILREVELGARFCCANYADVLIGCLRSLGYPTRFVGLRTEDAAYNMGGGHGCMEVWSNQYDKWILLDAQNNAWWESGGVPLSARECHLLFVSGHEDELVFVGQHEHIDYTRNKTFWGAYFHRVVNYWLGETMELVTGEVVPELLYQNSPENIERTDQLERVYPQLNRTRMTLQHESRDALGSLIVTLHHTMPYFDGYLVRIDDKEWRESGEQFGWVLHEGENTIEARAVNDAGIEGRLSRIVVRNNLHNLE